ncbi:MAG: hypothetical protein QOF26_3705, partial [Baekduia sp.]|nr:hypothetical protein [Baekduia sp.]
APARVIAAVTAADGPRPATAGAMLELVVATAEQLVAQAAPSARAPAAA